MYDTLVTLYIISSGEVKLTKLNSPDSAFFFGLSGSYPITALETIIWLCISSSLVFVLPHTLLRHGGLWAPSAFWGWQVLCAGWVWLCCRLRALWGAETYIFKLVDNCLKGEVNAEKTKAACCLADQNEASWVFQSNKTPPSEWFQGQVFNWACGARESFAMSRLFQPAYVRFRVSLSLVCFVFKEGGF